MPANRGDSRRAAPAAGAAPTLVTHPLRASWPQAGTGITQQRRSGKRLRTNGLGENDAV